MFTNTAIHIGRFGYFGELAYIERQRKSKNYTYMPHGFRAEKMDHLFASDWIATGLICCSLVQKLSPWKGKLAQDQTFIDDRRFIDSTMTSLNVIPIEFNWTNSE